MSNKRPKLLFVPLSYNMHLSYHHGIGILAAVAKQCGAWTSVYQIHPDLNRPPIAEKCAEEISSFNADFICISSSSLEWQFAKALAIEIKKVSNSKLIVGGPHPTFCNNYNDGFNLFDHVAIGEGEEIIKKIISGKSLDGKMVRGEMVGDLNTLPMSDRESFEMEKIIIARNGIIDFLTQRGCPYNCSYCSNHALRTIYGGKYLRRRSVKNVIEEIKSVIKKYPCKIVFFHDDIFTLNKDWTKEFCRMYKKEIGMPWMINSHINHIDSEIAELLSQTGCIEIKFGVESGCENTRYKALNKQISNDKIRDRFKMVRDAGIRTFAFMMHVTPGETKSSYEKSVQLMAEIKPNVIRSTIFFPLPNTALGNPFFKIEEGLNTSMLGDNPSSPLGNSTESLSKFYMFGWRINLLMGLKEYDDLIRKHSQTTRTSELKIIDATISKKLSSLGKHHYRFGGECSMLKLEDGKKSLFS